MAQSGFTPILIYGSTTTGNTPSASNLTTTSLGVELAINATDGKLFYKDNAGNVQTLATKATGTIGGSNTQVQYNSSGSLAGSANLTFNGTTLTTANDASISGLTVGKGASGLSLNTVVGNYALGSNTTGNENSAFGSYSLVASTTGAYNVGIGNYALGSNTTGNCNVAIGRTALNSNTTASNNTAVGYQAGYSNTTGTTNTFIGYQAAYSNTTGYGIHAFGALALYSNTTGYDNYAFGGTDATSIGPALYANTTGYRNSAFGGAALGSNTTGATNSAFGVQALASNTTASNNTAVGFQAGYTGTIYGANAYFGNGAGYNCQGANNTYVGSASGPQGSASSGNGNNGFGINALASVTSGTQNTALGYQSAYYITTGSKNSILGSYNGNQGGLDIRTASNYIVLSDGDGNPGYYVNGAGASVTGTLNSASGNRFVSLAFNIAAVNKSNIFWDNTNTALYVQNSGGGGVYLAGTGTSWTANSDSRLKNVIGTFANALDDVAQLEAVKFTWKSDESNKPCVGLIAQSVEKVLPEAVTKNTIPKSDDTTEYLGVTYTDVIPLLVAAIQELKAEVEAQAVEIATLKGQ